MFSFEDLFSGFPQYNEDEIPKDADVLQIMYYYKYIINIACIAGPWTLIVLGLVGYNIYFNMHWTRFWAGGNPWLILETLFLIA